MNNPKRFMLFLAFVLLAFPVLFDNTSIKDITVAKADYIEICNSSYDPELAPVINPYSNIPDEKTC